MTLGTILTLFVIPTVYSYLGKRLFKQVSYQETAEDTDSTINSATK